MLDQVALPIVQKIDHVLNMVTPPMFERMIGVFQDLFGLEITTVPAHRNNIKAIIKNRSFAFTGGQSFSSKAFVTLHSLGHYYFISAANRSGNDRYRYIYDSSDRQGALHIYETKNLHGSSQKLRRDRIDFELGANNFAQDLLRYVGLTELSEIVNTYQPGDINYIIDVTGNGVEAIVPTDRDYLERYICAGLTYEEEPNDDRIYIPNQFDVNGIDWTYLSNIDLEIHFF
ncbi:hypothetical protein [Pendulispora albinea]|uniref:Uncharacterized protein n=1 Tax=Pendulispora albinea TaxID=2741071 RepID=A0ABZ2M4T9_9BACT